ncbi:hypothetical protein J6590_046543 [Homalodisca vitripennis]|nr:hypothetical protein J6590_046543 [Homalodisca vitripennis]
MAPVFRREAPPAEVRPEEKVLPSAETPVHTQHKILEQIKLTTEATEIGEAQIYTRVQERSPLRAWPVRPTTYPHPTSDILHCQVVLSGQTHSLTE